MLKPSGGIGKHRASEGFGLVEVLIAVVLLSIGLLGLAGLQTLSLQRATSAAQRVEAVNHAYDLLDRMRANRTRAVAGDYNVEFGSTPDGDTLAEQDLAAWKAQIAAALPDGDGSVVVTIGAFTNPVADITIRWSDASDANRDGATTSTVSLRTQL